MKIFEKNIFENASTIPLYKKLLGQEGFKPFECVGTAKETTEAFKLIEAKGELNDTPVMKIFRETQ